MTECWCDHFFCLCIVIKIDLLEVSDHIFLRNVCSKHTVNLLCIKWNAYRFFLLAIYVDCSSDNFTCSKLFYKLAGTVQCIHCVVRVKSLLKLTGSICTKSDTLTGLTDVHPIKTSCLKKHCLRVICDHGILSSHDSGDSNSLFSVTDHQNILVHCSFLSIQCDEFISILCILNYNLMSCKCVQIIRMHRLSVFFHYIVCNIYQVVDRTDSNR